MKSTVTLFAAIASLWCHSQTTPRTLLWRISGQELAEPSFLYGTVHSRDERAYLFTEMVEQYMDSVATVAGELDLEEAKRQGLRLMTAMMMPDGKRLEDLYRKKEWKVVEAGLQEKLGTASAMVMRMKPFLVLATLTEAGMEQDRDLMLDDHLLRRSKADEHRVIGLETMDEQLRALDVLTLEEQADLLLEHFRNGGYDGEMEAMMTAYAAQDLDALMEVAQASSTMPAKVEKSLIQDRNKVMAHRMDSVMRVDGSAIFLIGAAHLPGEEGIMELLRARGYAVDPVFRGEQGHTDSAKTRYLANGIHYTNDSLRCGVDMPGRPIDAGDGLLMHRVDTADRTVILTKVMNKEPGQDMDAFITREFGSEPAPRISTVEVQGMNARRAMVQMDEVSMEMLVVDREGAYFMVTVVAADEGFRDQVIRSFHFTDLPDQ